jgi:hypothetical protein
MTHYLFYYRYCIIIYYNTANFSVKYPHCYLWILTQIIRTFA